MRTELFDFDLPPERIALRPVTPRDAAKLLVVRPGWEPQLSDATMTDLPQLLRAGDALVVNRTRVIPAQLRGRRLGADGAQPRIDATLHKRMDDARWRAFVRPAKKLRTGDAIRFGDEGRICLLGFLDATVEAKGDGGEVTLAFSFSGPALDEAIEAVGGMPLPPYIASRRMPDEQDRDDYQTIFAREEGSVAAPTAGLHFTPALIEALRLRDVSIHDVTLHVGAGTFLPVKTDDTADHPMQPEWAQLDADTAHALNSARARGGRIVAVGSTALRTIESAADANGALGPFKGETSLFITPGYQFRAVDLLLTNFHLPRSTLFMLVAAFSGLELMQSAYAHALNKGYRFYSYGDACLLHPAAP
jgi:S-adenosylmethionine:tRNA ribosyltransferase-isomerase